MGTYGATTRYNHDKCRAVLLTFLEEFPYNVPFIMDDVMDYIIPLPGHMLKDVQPSKSKKVGRLKQNRYGDTNFFSQILHLALRQYNVENDSLVVRGRWKLDSDKDSTESKRAYVKLESVTGESVCFDCGIPIRIEVKFQNKSGDVRYFNRTFNCQRCYEIYCGRVPQKRLLFSTNTETVIDEEDDNEEDDNWLDELMIMEDDENEK
tara:strand:- start:1321 stop:1941 length:621 start_codon:yes stop_codon:yes gene_type:complete